MLRFEELVARVPTRGVGLSVELYDPPLAELLAGFAATAGAIGPEYVEIYRAATADLRSFRAAEGREMAAEYHADGLWMVQPGYLGSRQCEAEVENIAVQTSILGSSWANHECATKQLYGHTFGSFVSPLLTALSARTIGRNAAAVQAAMGDLPLLLLETPSYNYWSSGDLRLADFFSEIYRDCPAGICLDIGHVYTWFQLERARSGIDPDRFLADWLASFPLERVVEMHVAGSRIERLDEPALGGPDGTRLVDHHPSPIPPVYLEWLAAHLRHPRVTNLRGVAFEVDGKAVAEIVREFQQVRALVRTARPAFGPSPAAEVRGGATRGPAVSGGASDAELERAYRRYIGVIAGTELPGASDGPPSWLLRERESLRECYERMRGGDLRSMFPDTCAMLGRVGVPVSDFDTFFERSPAFEDAAFDFFRLVLLSFRQWAEGVAARLSETAARELRDAAARETDFLLEGQTA